jgi:hypothetical protein
MLLRHTRQKALPLRHLDARQSWAPFFVIQRFSNPGEIYRRKELKGKSLKVRSQYNITLANVLFSLSLSHSLSIRRSMEKLAHEGSRRKECNSIENKLKTI